MNRFKNEVAFIDSGKKTPKDFATFIALDENSVKWYEVFAAATLYIEDGGTKYTAEEFIELCKTKVPDDFSYRDWIEDYNAETL